MEQSTHDRALELVSGANSWNNLHYFEPEPVPRLQGLAVGPKGQKIGQQPGAKCIVL